MLRAYQNVRRVYRGKSGWSCKVRLEMRQTERENRFSGIRRTGNR